MLIRGIVACHFAMYQTLVAFAGIVAILLLLSPYTRAASCVYAGVTVGSYWIGQGLVVLLQKRKARRSDSLD